MPNRRGSSSHLSLVSKDGTPLESAIAAGVAAHGPDAPRDEHPSVRDASQVVGNAVAHAAMSWVACCMERAVDHVDVEQVGRGAFQATVHFKDGEGSFMLSVALLLETGPRLTCQVEPIHP